MRIRKIPSIAGLASLLFFLLFTLIFTRQQTSLNPKASNTPLPTISPTLILTSDNVIVKRVVDGDTIELQSGQKVRYIGVNTPETVDPRRPVECFGKEAKEKNKELVEGKIVRLEKDVSETDKYGRLLRYVFLKNENRGEILVNEVLVRMGYAYSSSYPPDVKYQELLRVAERQAREGENGLWSVCQENN